MSVLFAVMSVFSWQSGGGGAWVMAIQRWRTENAFSYALNAPLNDCISVLMTVKRHHQHQGVVKILEWANQANFVRFEVRFYIGERHVPVYVILREDDDFYMTIAEAQTIPALTNTRKVLIIAWVLGWFFYAWEVQDANLYVCACVLLLVVIVLTHVDRKLHERKFLSEVEARLQSIS